MSELFKLPKVTYVFFFYNFQSNQYLKEDTIFLPIPNEIILSETLEKLGLLNPFNNHCCLQ